MSELARRGLFGPDNLPYCVFSHRGWRRRIGVALGDDVLDVAPLVGAEFAPYTEAPVLNPLLAAGRPVWTRLRERLRELVDRGVGDEHRVPRAEVVLRLPFEVADYVDFYSSEHHATNVGRIFRPDGEALTPNWKHLPIGYHGRAGTVVVSGTDVVRPCGQRRSREGPVYGPSRRLDIEAEIGFVLGGPTRLGERVPVEAVEEHVFGAVLLNDWSARDIQAWEYVPLGPFLGKSFATSISPWVVPLDALDAARVPPPPRDPPLLPYLRDADDRGLDVALEVAVNGHVVSRPPFAEMYWTVAQQVAHLTVNGATIRAGDLIASGTVSGPEREQCGSLLELSWGGKEPLALPDGTTRTFLEDGDEVVITATAPGPAGSRIGLGEVRGRILPAHP